MSNHRPDSAFAEILRTVCAELQQQCLREAPTSEVLIQQGSLSFVGVWTGLEASFEPDTLRRTIGHLTQQGDGFRIVQVVGDCTCQFSTVGITKAKSIIEPLLSSATTLGKQTVLEYGYTASNHDVNWIVNDVIARMPELSLRTIANVVHMSAAAIEGGNFEASGVVRNFVLAYNDEGETTFGSDMWLSDSVMNAAYGDKLICIEGGPQTFAQAVSACIRGMGVIALTGNNTRLGASQAPSVHFSAAHALNLLHTYWLNCADRLNVTDEERSMMVALVTAYIDRLPDLQTSNNPQRLRLIRASLETIVDNASCLQHLEIILAD